jgi:hypothetical protein
MTSFTRFMARLLIWLGILLPLYTVGFELWTRACAGSFFDPMPTWLHVVAILLVPATCYLTWRLRDSTNARLMLWTGILNRAAWPVAILYGVVFAPLSFIACAFLPMSLIYGLTQDGLLPMMVLATLGPWAGLTGLGLSTASLRGLRSTLPDVEVSRLRHKGRYGWLAGVLLLGVAEGPGLWTVVWMDRAVHGESSAQTTALRALRATGDQKLMLAACYRDRGAGTFGPIAALLSTAEGMAGPSRALFADAGPLATRRLFYQVTGIPFNDLPPPRKRETLMMGRGEVQEDTSLEEFVWDGERGGDAVGARLRGLSLASSSLDWHLDSPSGLAYGEWTMEFRNQHGNAQEARCQILLPPGACVSRLTLWVNGKPQEAAFGAKAQVKAAYRQVVVVENRDPVMVNMVGPDRIMTQCFPVPPGGLMKIRLGITAPCDEQTWGQLAMPVILERNFTIPENFQHRLASRADQEPVQERGVTTGELPGVFLKPPAPSAISVWAQDPFAQDEALYLVRMRRPVWQARAKQLIVVVDASRSLAPHAAAIRETLLAVPSHIPLKVILTTDREPWVVGRSDLGAALVKSSFAGGRDSAPALKRALELAREAGAEEIPTLVWLHGPQPWSFDADETEPAVRNEDSGASDGARAFSAPEPPGDATGIKALLASFPEAPEIHAVGVSHGPSRLLEKLYQFVEIHSGSRWDGSAAGLTGLMERIVGEGERWQYEYTREAAPPPDIPQVPDHLVRHHVYTAVLDEFKGTNLVPEALAQRAARYQLVTPYSGAVVLETQEQYDRAGLAAVDPESTPKIPNVVPEPSRMLLLLAGLMLMICRRQRALVARKE